MPLTPFLSRTSIAYFTMEIALRPEIHTYSGGLGVLAGDSARSAADLGLPMVFVTLVSRSGYVRQSIEAGHQIDEPDPWRPEGWVEPLPARASVEIAGRTVLIRPWLYVIRAGEFGVPVILLDTDLLENAEEDRHITDRLYGGDDAYRLKQEIVLGIGGERMLRALGFAIRKFHLNEGHAALLPLALLRDEPDAMPDPGPEAIAGVQERCVFTTHTPVEAGQDRFDYGLAEHLLGGFVSGALLRRLAGERELNMTRLALNLAGFTNGVAERHAETTSHMFPGYHIHAITNGVHLPTWAHPSFAALFDAEAAGWHNEPKRLAAAESFSDEAVLAAHAAAKRDLFELVRHSTGAELDPDALTIGFARRMTAYKRPGLLFSDVERLASIAARHPIQLVMAGKAHPKDEAGKRLIQTIDAYASALTGRVKLAYLPNYGLGIAGTIVSGVDVWLNTPRPPLEASGTSGMKAALNGVLNFSVLDGWWIEGCQEGVTGWAIGEDRGSAEEHAEILYDKLAHVVLPLFHEDRPRWVWMMKQAIARLAPRFNTHVMMRRYAAEAYFRWTGPEQERAAAGL